MTKPLGHWLTRTWIRGVFGLILVLATNVDAVSASDAATTKPSNSPYDMSVQVRTDGEKSKFLFASIELVNHSKNPIFLEDLEGEVFRPIEVTAPDGTSVPMTRRGRGYLARWAGSASIKGLSPGQRYSEDIPVSCFFELQSAGTYTLEVNCPIILTKEAAGSGPRDTSTFATCKFDFTPTTRPSTAPIDANEHPVTWRTHVEQGNPTTILGELTNNSDEPVYVARRLNGIFCNVLVQSSDRETVKMTSKGWSVFAPRHQTKPVVDAVAPGECKKVEIPLVDLFEFRQPGLYKVELRCWVSLSAGHLGSPAFMDGESSTETVEVIPKANPSTQSIPSR
jgi:hypothetical protein